MEDAFVGVDHLFQVNILIGTQGEGGIAIERAIKVVRLIQAALVRKISGDPDPPAEISTIGSKQDMLIEIGVQLFEGLVDFFKVLMVEKLVYRYVLISLAKVGGLT